jgi:signal transduction histidine kinase
MRAAGFGTWLVVVLANATELAWSELTSPRALGFAIAAVVFLAAFVMACRTPTSRPGVELATRVAQSLGAIAMVWFGRGVVTAAIFVVVATQLPGVVSGGVAMAWVVAQSVAIWARVDTLHAGPALASCATFVGFQAFALAAASLAASERRARGAAVEHSRTVERLRVARDLHDTLGHQLTALGMQLEVAGRLADGRVKEHVERAHAIGRLLLADVRGAVRDLRDSRPLGAALRNIVAAHGNVAVHLDLDDELETLGGDQADAIIRCVQEVMTNTARHGDARNLWIAITADRLSIRVHARDDGTHVRASDSIVWGHGLIGMRERFAALDGQVDARRSSDGGFELEASMPRRHP